MSTKVTTPEFRVAFPCVFRPRKNELNGKDEYSVVALFPKGTSLESLKKAAHAALVKKFGDDQRKWPKDLKSPFKDQGDRSKFDEELGKEVLPQGYEKGAIYINLKSTQRPGVVDQKVEKIMDEADFYGGCWARAAINAYAYDMKGNRGVAFGLQNIQKTKDGDHFGNKSKPEDDFSPVDTGEENSEGSDVNSLFS